MSKIQSLTPTEIVAQLDRFIVGQSAAKKAVAIALRNRWRRKNIESDLKDEIVPKNILMVGPTGVGKTEIARRLAKLANSPFIKVEATKFTEVGYVGRDVESIIRDLLDNAIYLVKERYKAEIVEAANEKAIDRILDVLVGKSSSTETREKYKESLLSGSLDDQIIEIDIIEAQTPSSMDISMPGAQMGIINVSDMLSKVMGGDKTKKKSMTVKEALEVILAEETDKLLDNDKVNRDAVSLVEQDGIVFIDEIDKISGRSDARGGEVSREGVQRDLLPLIEGTTVSTKFGIVKTDHILFIASGAFHLTKPSDLLPELQGRLPIRVELNALTESDMCRILSEPEVSLPKQYAALLKTENVNLIFEESGIKAIAKLSAEVNQNIENIGARRLHTIMEKLLEDISFESCSYKKSKKIIIDEKFVMTQLGDITKQSDLSKFIL
jgi:ATP-dependent HslUV protease ATP-binding subunit HslU